MAEWIEPARKGEHNGPSLLLEGAAAYSLSAPSSREREKSNLGHTRAGFGRQDVPQPGTLTPAASSVASLGAASSCLVDDCPYMDKLNDHDWTECPFAHPGEKARRRDPSKHAYSSVACPDFRKSSCKRGDSCPYAHGVFECWLHPDKYCTQLCKDANACQRCVCFFAHNMEELRTPDPSEAIPVLQASAGSPVPPGRASSASSTANGSLLVDSAVEDAWQLYSPPLARSALSSETGSRDTSIHSSNGNLHMFSRSSFPAAGSRQNAALSCWTAQIRGTAVEHDGPPAGSFASLLGTLSMEEPATPPPPPPPLPRLRPAAIGGTAAASSPIFKGQLSSRGLGGVQGPTLFGGQSCPNAIPIQGPRLFAGQLCSRASSMQGPGLPQLQQGQDAFFSPPPSPASSMTPAFSPAPVYSRPPSLDMTNPLLAGALQAGVLQQVLAQLSPQELALLGQNRLVELPRVEGAALSHMPLGYSPAGPSQAVQAGPAAPVSQPRPSAHTGYSWGSVSPTVPRTMPLSLTPLDADIAMLQDQLAAAIFARSASMEAVPPDVWISNAAPYGGTFMVPQAPR